MNPGSDQDNHDAPTTVSRFMRRVAMDLSPPWVGRGAGAAAAITAASALAEQLTRAGEAAVDS